MKTACRMMVIAGMIALGAGLARAEQPTAPAGDADKAAQMAAMQKLAAPSEGHRALEPFVGNWTYTMQWWMTPDAPPESMSGTTNASLVFGGRFLKQDVRGESAMAGQPPFEGAGYTGYDNIRNEYQSVWLYNMGTGMMVSTGKYDPAAKTLTEEGTFSCPMSGEANRKFRGVWKVVDATHNVYEGYSWTPEGKEYKSMEIQYTKAQ